MTVKKNNQESEIIADEIKKCFVMMPIADHSDYDTGHFNRVYEYLIKPACIKAGYQPIRADDTKASNMIMFDILKKIVECDMAICDLSSRNANVFYELGLRQAFNKKTILITDNLLPTPFDISAFRYVSYSHTLRVDTVDREIPSIVNMLKETENQPDDDVNSIIKLLQIQPTKVERIDLNKEESVLYEMLLNLQKQISELGKSKPSTSSSYYQELIKKANSNIKFNNNLDIDGDLNFSGVNIKMIMKSFPEHLHALEYKFRDQPLGKLESIINGNATFNRDGAITVIPYSEAQFDSVTVV